MMGQGHTELREIQSMGKGGDLGSGVLVEAT